MNLPLLKETLRRRGYSYEKMCVELHCSYNTFCSRMAGRSEFTIDEANVLADRLELNNTEIINIFFNGGN